MNRMTWFIIGIVLVSLNGCSLFEPEEDLPIVEWEITEAFTYNRPHINDIRVSFKVVGTDDYRYYSHRYYSDSECKNELDINQFVLINGEPIKERTSVWGQWGAYWYGGVQGYNFIVMPDYGIVINDGDILTFKHDWFFRKDYASTEIIIRIKIITEEIPIEIREREN